VLWLLIGIGTFGFSIGLLSGLSSTPVVKTLLGLLFTFAGGSLILILSQSPTEAGQLGKLLTTFAVSMVFGVLLGVLIREKTKKRYNITVMPYAIDKEELRVEKVLVEAANRLRAGLDSGETDARKFLRESLGKYRVTDGVLKDLAANGVSEPILDKLQSLNHQALPNEEHEYLELLSKTTEAEITGDLRDILLECTDVLSRTNLAEERLREWIEDSIRDYGGYQFAPAGLRTIIDCTEYALQLVQAENPTP